MGANKSPPTSGALKTTFSVMRFALRPQHRGAVLTIVVIAASIVGALYAWQRWGEPATRTSDYAVTADRIYATPQPAWIHADVKTEVLRLASQGPLNLRDPKLVEHIAHAFALHPWVARVVKVEKRYPAQVRVELQYRRPVIVVKVDAPGDQGLLFLDEQSVLLPSADFAPSQARDYLRLAAAGEAPAGAYGNPWGSQRVAGAARLAAALGNRWQALGLYWIVTSRPASGELLYELRTQDDRVRVIWGPAAASESPGEPSAEEKIVALERYVQDKGSLNRPEGSPLIDLRELARGPTNTASAQKL